MALSVQVIVAIALGAVTLVASLLLCFLLCFLKKRTATSGQVGVMQPLDNSLPDASMASDLGVAELGSTLAADDTGKEPAVPITSSTARLYMQQSARALASAAGSSRPTSGLPRNSDNDSNGGGDDIDDDDGIDAVWAFPSDSNPARPATAGNQGTTTEKSPRTAPLNTPASMLADSTSRPRRPSLAHRHDNPPPAPEVDDDFVTPELLQSVAALDAPEDEFFLIVVQAEPGLLVAEPRLLTFPYVPGFEGLGITLAGSRPVRIMTVEPGSPAEIGGAIVGDCILQINGHMCFHLPHHRVVQLMAEELNLMRLVTVDDLPASEEIDSHIDLGLNSPEGPDARTAQWIKTLPRRTDVSKLHSRAFEMQTMASQMLSAGEFTQAERLLNQTMDVLDQLEKRNKVLGTSAGRADRPHDASADGDGHPTNSGQREHGGFDTPQPNRSQTQAPATEPVGVEKGGGGLDHLPKRKGGADRGPVAARPSSAVRRVPALPKDASHPPRSVKRFNRMAAAKERMLNMPSAPLPHTPPVQAAPAVPLPASLRKAPPPLVPPAHAALMPEPKTRGSPNRSRGKRNQHQYQHHHQLRLRRHHSEQLPASTTAHDSTQRQHSHGHDSGRKRRRRRRRRRPGSNGSGEESEEHRPETAPRHSHRHSPRRHKGGSHRHNRSQQARRHPHPHHPHHHRRRRRHVRSERKGLSPSESNKATVFRPINAVSVTPATKDVKSDGPLLLKRQPLNETRTSSPSAPAGHRLSARDFIQRASSRFVVLRGAHAATSTADTLEPRWQSMKSSNNNSSAVQPRASPPSIPPSSALSTRTRSGNSGAGEGSGTRVSMRQDLLQQQRRLEAWMAEDPDNIV